MILFDGVRQLFPEGTLGWRIVFGGAGEEKTPLGSGAGAWDEPPEDPIDLFAIVCFLLSRSGAYHHVQPETAPPVTHGGRRVTVSESDREIWRPAGRAWSAPSSVKLFNEGKQVFARLTMPPIVRELWTKLRQSFEEPVFAPLKPDQPAPGWWNSALALLVISDEAAMNVGFLGEERLGASPMGLLHYATEARIRQALDESPDGEGMGAYTLSAAAPDVICVLPKSRTPALGCTMRSLSHNLAMLPPRGLARARWIAPAASSDAHDAVSPLNLLLIPYPYAVPASAFRTMGESTVDSCVDWGWFSVAPREGSSAERKKFVKFVKDLLVSARADNPAIHGVVFPELALTHRLYVDLVETLQRDEGIELLVAGLNTSPDKKDGNFAVTRIISRSAGASKEVYAEDIRQKHHRWRLERTQITSYALGSQLDPSRYWWERLDVLSRSLTVGVIRGETTMATLICEDLARVDPAQELLRAIGPNLVFALLMDGAQLVTRWPNRYATVLAEDPGSSVLTLTSLGLIDRVNKTGFHDPSRCIALWRDDQGVRELTLPPNAHALCLMLSPTKLEEATLDGRSDDRNSVSWRLSGVQPVAVSGTDVPDWVG
ncbi:MAG: hypothetical protein WBR13_13305 [Allosphingosinicella sp.]